MKPDNKAFSENFKRRIYTFILRLIKFVETLPKSDDLCRIARDQLIRSGTSVGANYIEAIAGSSKKDFTNFLSHSLKSANESKFWLALLRDAGKGDKIEITGEINFEKTDNGWRQNGDYKNTSSKN